MMSANQPYFHIYRASAGSGKTYALARCYLELALQRPEAFRHILGVTFTNKATAEMKNRILENLEKLSNHPDIGLGRELCESLGLSEDELCKRVKQLRSQILHRYHQFSIVTIDSFFNQVVRAFAREIGLQGSFGISLDTDAVLERITDDMIASLGEENQRPLRKWLTRFAEVRLEDGKPWDFKQDIQKLACQLFVDQFKPYASEVLALQEKPAFFVRFLEELDKTIFRYEKSIKKTAQDCLEQLASMGFSPDEFKGGKSSSLGKVFKRVAEGNFNLTDAQLNGYDDPEKWMGKSDLKDLARSEKVITKVMPLYRELLDAIESGSPDYQSALEIKKYIYTYGILSSLTRQLELYREAEDTMLISDLPELLRQVINDSETPYVFEKVGSRYEHFLIDEFQDTSFFQWENFKPLVKNNVDSGLLSLIVGDAKQSIYRWRGGDWRLLQAKAAHDIGIESSQFISLNDNWRSSPVIVDFNNFFFKQASRFFESSFPDHHPDEIQAFRGIYDDVEQQPKQDSPGMVKVQFLQDEEDTKWRDQALELAILEIEKAIANGYDWRDIAILTRDKKEGREIVDAIMEHKKSPKAIPGLTYEILSSDALLLSSGLSVCFLTSLMKWLMNEKDELALTEWLHFYHLLNADTELIEAFADRGKWINLVPAAFFNQKKYLKSLPIYELTESLIRIFNLQQNKQEFSYLIGFQDAILEYNQHERGDISSFLQWWEAEKAKRTIILGEDNNAIRVMTVHKSKGLQFPIVILPFLNWPLDHKPNHENILWVPPVNISPFDQLPVIPLRYGQSINNTHWASHYHFEKASAFMDNLNLLYVAFTRAEQVLVALGGETKKMSDSVCGMTRQVLGNASGWNAETAVFQSGDFPPKNNTKPAVRNDEIALEQLHSYPWRAKVGLQIRQELAATETNRMAQKWGVQLHKDLGKLKSIDDLYSLADPMLKRELKLIVMNEQIEPFFRDVTEVKVEEPILLPGGEMKRIDRLVRKNNEWWLIDFKTGQPRPQDQSQVGEYMQILREMGYENIRGFLVYLDPVVVEEVAHE